ncbi:DUF6228 family protein [Streptomyces sp. NPDC058409]|uniref:DUF6228 family protein n=1 Tax=Streptomyces sp. NPDC058409 TaxID=3346484 RepID=UPI00365D1CE6
MTISAEHRPWGYVHLAWGIHDRPPSEEWHFETTTVHAAGEDCETSPRIYTRSSRASQ